MRRINGFVHSVCENIDLNRMHLLAKDEAQNIIGKVLSDKKKSQLLTSLKCLSANIPLDVCKAALKFYSFQIFFSGNQPTH